MPADGGMMPADGGFGGGGWQPGMPGGNDMGMTVGAGIGVGPGYVVGEHQTGPSTVTTTVTKVGEEESSGPVSKGPIICCLSCVALLVLYSMAAGMTSDIHITAQQHRWRFEVHTQVFVVEQRGGWQRHLPYDSYNRMCRLRYHDTTRVMISQVCHDEHTTRQSTSCHTSNGMRTCQTVSTPVVQHICNPVYQYYRNYATWCDYSVNRWRDQVPAVSEGAGLQPYWPYAPVSNCGMIGCTRMSHTEQHFMVDFHIDDGHSAGSTDTCRWTDPGMWAWVQDNAQYQAQANNFGASILCETVQTPHAAPAPAHYNFVPRGGNYSDAPQQPPASMTTAPPGPQYAAGGQFTGTVPPPAPAPPPAFLMAEEPIITELTEEEAAALAEAPADGVEE